MAVAMTAFVISLYAAEGSKAQTHCPIEGGKIDKDVFVDVDGKRVYFCCPGCDTEFLKAGSANVKKMEKDGIKLATAICPVSGDEGEPDVSFKHGERTYYVCCKKCLKKFKSDPVKYLQKKKGHGGHDRHDHGKHKH
jgi:YHS domain-containing protein